MLFTNTMLYGNLSKCGLAPWSKPLLPLGSPNTIGTPTVKADLVKYVGTRTDLLRSCFLQIPHKPGAKRRPCSAILGCYPKATAEHASQCFLTVTSRSLITIAV